MKRSFRVGVVIGMFCCGAFALEGLAQYGREFDFDPVRVGGFPEGPMRDDIVPGAFIIDPPTLENLGFRWYIEGDSNRNAEVEVAFRRKGETEWREALPMHRVHHEIATRFRRGDQYTHWRTGNLFAGSVLFLDPGTAYEVRFVMSDPDGGAPAAPKLVTVATRSEVAAAAEGRLLHVHPPGFSGARETEFAFNTIHDAFAEAQPGDIIYLHAGVHTVPDKDYGPSMDLPPGQNWGSRTPLAAIYPLEKSGAPGKPIVFRGAGVDATIIEGRDHGTDLFRVIRADHLVFEDMTLRRAHSAFRGGSRGGPSGSWLTIRRCRIEDVVNGVWTFSERSANWHITDNVITGIDEAWYPRTTPGVSHVSNAHTGVNLYGQGHVVSFNRISRFSDSVALADFSSPNPDDIYRHAVNIDIHNNDLSWASDDTIEADYGCHNIRVYRNLCYNTHTGLSVQPAYGGPIYLIRNLVYGVTGLAWKWNNHPAGPVAYHNTTVTAGAAFTSPLWSNGHLRNNLFLGNGAKLSSGTLTPERSTLDFNGYRGSIIRWTQGDTPRADYPTLQAFFDATGFEENGIEVAFDSFVNAAPVERGRTYTPADFDLRLRSGANAVDAGVRLPGINDDFTGRAPDLGALERGRPVPHYGPRWE